jgi:hypothetical protein
MGPLVDLTLPILVVLNTGDPIKDDPFNYFFTLMLCVGIVLFIPAAILAVVNASMRD